tara:strand:- start:226 stop:411 length:186 start_codon:yes stop_codon:yes gene_type:complete
MKYFKKIWSWLPKKTPRNTIMWVQVPMTCNNRQDKDDVIMSTINHLEQTIKINKLCQKKSM